MEIGRIPFDVNQSNVVSSLSMWSYVMAIVHFVAAVGFLGVGCLSLVGGVVAGGALAAGAGVGSAAVGATLGLIGGFSMVLLGGVAALQGGWLWGAGRDFHEVVSTDGADQALMTSGFDRLRRFFWVHALSGAIGVLAALAEMAGTLL